MCGSVAVVGVYGAFPWYGLDGYVLPIYEGLEGGPPYDMLLTCSGLRFRRRKTRRATNANVRAAPPMAIPAMGPPPSAGEEGADVGEGVVEGVFVTV